MSEPEPGLVAVTQSEFGSQAIGTAPSVLVSPDPAPELSHNNTQCPTQWSRLWATQRGALQWTVTLKFPVKLSEEIEWLKQHITKIYSEKLLTWLAGVSDKEWRRTIPIFWKVPRREEKNVRRAARNSYLAWGRAELCSGGRSVPFMAAACACDTDVREKISSKPSNFLTNGFYICDLLLLIKLWHVHVIWIWKQCCNCNPTFLDTYNAVQCISCLELLWRIFVKQIKESLKLRVN